MSLYNSHRDEIGEKLEHLCQIYLLLAEWLIGR